MKMLFIFASVNGLQTYTPIVSALLEKGHVVDTIVTPEPTSPFPDQPVSVIEEKRRDAFNQIKRMDKLELLFVEQEFAWLANYNFAEHILKPEQTVEQIMSIVEKHHSNALA